MKRIFLLSLVFASVVCSAFQLRGPMDIPIELSANFGELRANHFHSGLDLKTEQKIGQPVYAVYDGYVSRINIAPNGYGNCLYINHPEIGLTTVYAHLDSFEPFIDSLLKVKQYDVRNFAVDYTLDSMQIPVKKGQRVATSGNSGSSGGPHLHFETRDMLTEVLYDPQNYYDIPDATKPRIHRIYVTPVAGEGVVDGSAISKSYSVDQIKKNPPKAYGRVGIGVRANDYMTGTGNVYGVRTMKVEVDGVTKFLYQNDGFSFDSTRFINSFIDYATWVEKREMVMKAYLPDNPCTEFIREQTDGGYLLIDENRDYKVKVTVADYKGNSSVVNFTIKGDSTVIPVISAYNGGKYFMWNLPNEIEDGGFEFHLPKGALYNTIYFKYKAEEDTTAYSLRYQLHYATVPLQKYATLRIPVSRDVKVGNEYYVAYSADGKSWSYSGKSNYKDGYIETTTRALGYYKVMADSKSPSVQYKGMTGNTVMFKVSDAESGIDRIEGEVDGEWACFYYDAKTRTASYTFDPARVTSGKNHKVEVNVKDNCGNINISKVIVYW